MRVNALFSAALAALLGFSVLAATPARATHGRVDLTVDGGAAIGESFELVATLTNADSRQPIPGASITLEYLASFAGERSFVVLGRARTSEAGVAAFAFAPRVTGQYRLRATYSMGDGEDVGTETTTVVVAASDLQLYRSEGGLRIFGHEWILITVVAAVWLVIFAVALGIADIARAAGPGQPGVAPAPAQGDGRT